MARAMMVDLLMALQTDTEACRQAVVEFLRLAPENVLALQVLEQLNARQAPSLSSRVTVAANYPVAI